MLRLSAFPSLSAPLTAQRCEPAGRGWGLSGRPGAPAPRRRRGVGGGRGPTPAGSQRSGNRASEPPEPTSVDRQRHVPGLGLGSLLVQLLASDCCLPCCLTADAQGSSDLGPTRSLVPGGVDHEIRCEVEALSGVSQPLEVLQGPLCSALDAVEALSRPAGPPPGRGARLAAHVNGSCHWLGVFGEASRQPLLTAPNSHRISANWQLANELFGGVVGVPCGVRLLISSYISRQRAFAGSQTTEKNDPRDAATSGGLITSQDK